MHQHQSIGERLKGFRRQMGWTQQCLHVKSNYRLRLRTIQRIESGRGRVSERHIADQIHCGAAGVFESGGDGDRLPYAPLPYGISSSVPAAQ